MKILDLQDLPKQDLWEAAHILNLVRPIYLLGSMKEQELLTSVEGAVSFRCCSTELHLQLRWLQNIIFHVKWREFKLSTLLLFKPYVPHTDLVGSSWNSPCLLHCLVPSLHHMAAHTHQLCSVSICFTPGDCWSWGWSVPPLLASWLFSEPAYSKGTCLNPTPPFPPVCANYVLLLW